MSQNQDVLERIRKDIETYPVLLFMKGNKQEPMCGFSAQVVQVLNQYGVDFHTVNVLEDWDLREGIKQYTNWPTIPQLYVKGEFVGGCDIAMNLHRKGELEPMIKKALTGN